MTWRALLPELDVACQVVHEAQPGAPRKPRKDGHQSVLLRQHRAVIANVVANSGCAAVAAARMCTGNLLPGLFDGVSADELPKRLEETLKAVKTGTTGGTRGFSFHISSMMALAESVRCCSVPTVYRSCS